MVALQRTLLIFLGGLLLIFAAWSGFQVHRLSAQRAEIKKDYSVLNNITYGLLSVNAWRDHIVRVVTHRIDDFQFTRPQRKAVKEEISVVLHAVINKADSMIDRKQKTLGGKLKKFAVKTLVNEDKLHAKVPEFAETIVSEIEKPKNKEKLKVLAQSKLEEFGTITYDSANDVTRAEDILTKYGASDLVSFNQNSQQQLDQLQERTYFFTYSILAIMVFFLVMWWILKKQQALHTPFFVLSVILALIVLFVGLTSPMIEIDARIKEMSFLLIGERISFHDQVIFFQSKSIVDVVRILIETGKYDSALVGILILLFSIVFPIAKLISTKLYLLGSERWRTNKVIQYFAFKSGKWSMADVNVVAIFMAYIGFKGILDSQLSNLNMKTDSLASISTNETSLQPGFLLFVAFVLFGLILSGVLQRITTLEKKTDAALPLQKNISHAIA
ncbi:paraquat-inducible protein A [Chryseolinea lacunae]|uniref:Paraquat-inducible protein A n=1 Tax=Chryseolinea lacunae TaxID=2801331 RepID=A0ABS1KRI1_9BACT|nr:paraquat-inducible protein A [Chryseolinea lacunae]MBL0742080.1 paraquat-inducible protein A [Chryseolinea lacunae]